MKAVEIKQFGLENLTVAERRDPEAGPGEVVIRVKACSLNYRDVLMAKGMYNPKQKLPLIPCSDGVGEVTAIGPGVTRAKVGDRVAGCFMQGLLSRPLYGDDSYFGMTLGGPRDGMLAEKVVLSEQGIVQIPEHLSWEEAATLPCAGLTAYSALFTVGHVRPGDNVVIQGTGGVSIFALQFCAAVGARAIVLSSSNDKLERAKSLGATALINYKEKPEWAKDVKALTGQGADHVVEVGGAGTLAQSIRAVRPGATISIIGQLSGGKAEVDVTPVLMRNIRLQGVFVGARDEFEAMNRFIAHKKLKPVVDKVFPLADARAAFEHMAAQKHLGKVCISL